MECGQNYLLGCPARPGPKIAFLNTGFLLKSIKNNESEKKDLCLEMQGGTVGGQDTDSHSY
jgi:hypothetical protein